MARCVAFAATMVAVVAASSGQSDVSGASGGLSLSFPSSRLWAPPEDATVAMRQAMAGSDTSAVFAEYHANLAHAGLAASDSRDQRIEQQRVADRVASEQTQFKPEKLNTRLDGLLQDNVPEHTGDKVLDRLAALHELVERKRQMRHAQHGDLMPSTSDQSAFLQPPAPAQSDTGTEMSFGKPKPLASFTETAASFTPGIPTPSSDGLLDPAEVQDGRLNMDGSKEPAVSSFSASPMSRASTASAFGRGDAIVSNLDSVVQGFKKLRGVSNPPPSAQPIAQGVQWPPSLASGPAQSSFSAASSSLPSAPHPAAQMDPSFAAAIGAAAPDLAQPMSMSVNMPSAPAPSSFSAPSRPTPGMDPSFAAAIGAAAPDLAGPPGGMSLNAPPSLPPNFVDSMTSPVQAMMGGAASGFGPISLPQAQSPPAQMPMSPSSPVPNSAHLFEAPQAPRPESQAAATVPVNLPAAPPAPKSSQAAQVPQAAQVIAPAVVFQPLVPSLSSVNAQPPAVPSLPSVNVQPPPVPPLSSVSGSFAAEPVPLGSTGGSSVDADLQRVNQTTAEDEKEIARIQAQMAASNPQVQLWVPNPQLGATNLVKMPVPQPVAPVVNRVQPVPVARPVPQAAPLQKSVTPHSAQGPAATPLVGSQPIIPVFDVDGNRIDADNEAMLRDLKGEVANFEQRVTSMEHQEASLLQMGDDAELPVQ